MIVEYSDLVGKPYEYGGRGPESYDCWGIIMEVYKRNNIIVPDYERPETWLGVSELMSKEVKHWQQCDKPNIGSVVYMRVQSRPHHVGLYIGYGKFLHTYEGSGAAIIDRIRFWEKQIVGYYNLRTD